MIATNIYNHIQITDRLSSSGQPTEEQFGQIEKLKYELVVNLAMTDSYNALADEANIVASLGMQYVHIPVPFDNPAEGHLEKFINLLKQNRDKRVWAHCAANYRVSAFLYLYHVSSLEMSKQEAEKIFLSHWQPDDLWQKFIRQHEKCYANDLSEN